MKFFLTWFLCLTWTVIFLATPLAALPADPPTPKKILISAVPQKDEPGPNHEILAHIARRLGASLSLRSAPFKRRLKMMEAGTIDLLPGLLRRPEREAYIRFIYPPYKTRSDTVFVIKKGSSVSIERYEDLYGLHIGTTIGSKYFLRFDSDPGLVKETVPRIEMNFKKLALGRIDTVISPEGAYADLLDKMSLKEKLSMAPYRFARTKHVFVGISMTSGICKRFPRIDEILTRMMKSGEIKQVYADYYRSRHLPVPAM